MSTAVAPINTTAVTNISNGGNSGNNNNNNTAATITDPLNEFATYEEYLDSQLSADDAEYIDSDALARSLVELGYRGNGECISRKEFEQRKAASARAIAAGINGNANGNRPVVHKLLAHQSVNRDLTSLALLHALATREDAVRSGRLSCIIFIRDFNSRGQEISGYIDYAQRLKSEDWSAYFSGRKRFLPRANDLSYFNWETSLSTSQHSSNFQVKADNSDGGLLFKNKRDRKVINVDPAKANDCGDNTVRIEIKTTEYAQCVIYDHTTRRTS